RGLQLEEAGGEHHEGVDGHPAAVVADDHRAALGGDVLDAVHLAAEVAEVDLLERREGEREVALADAVAVGAEAVEVQVEALDPLTDLIADEKFHHPPPRGRWPRAACPLPGAVCTLRRPWAPRAAPPGPVLRSRAYASEAHQAAQRRRRRPRSWPDGRRRGAQGAPQARRPAVGGGVAPRRGGQAPARRAGLAASPRGRPPALR